MQVRAKDELGAAVVVDADGLTHLWNHLEAYAGNVVATLSCVDGVERKFDTLPGLLAFENPERSLIRRIELYARNRDLERSATVELGRQIGTNASVTLSGEEHDVVSTKTKLMDTLTGMKAWYSLVSTLDLFVIWTVVIGGVLVLLQLMAPSGEVPRPGRTLAQALRALWSAFLFFAPFVAAIAASYWLRTRFFPPISFVLGHGVRRHQVNEQVRWTVLVGFFVGLAGSVAYAAAGGA